MGQSKGGMQGTKQSEELWHQQIWKLCKENPKSIIKQINEGSTIDINSFVKSILLLDEPVTCYKMSKNGLKIKL